MGAAATRGGQAAATELVRVDAYLDDERFIVAFTHQVGDGLHSAIIKATRLTTGQPTRATTVAGRDTLPLASQPGCC